MCTRMQPPPRARRPCSYRHGDSLVCLSLLLVILGHVALMESQALSGHSRAAPKG